MGKSRFRRTTAETGLSSRANRRNRFHIRRFINDHGYQVYELENRAEKRKIYIPRSVFGPFRACVKNILHTELNKPVPEVFEYSVSFLNRKYFFFKSSSADIDNLIIQDIEERTGSSGYLTISRRGLRALDELLYNDKLEHPNDVLEEIISYHKLFQFSFVKGSKSITSGLILRTDVLQQTGQYIPNLAQKVALDSDLIDDDAQAGPVPLLDERDVDSSADSALFGRKLGERSDDRNITVDYEEVFGDKTLKMPTATELESSPNSKGKARLFQFLTPLNTTDIKKFENGKFHFELSTAEATEFRERFINDRSADYYLGFEIVDALYSANRTVKTFRFPLYYTKIRIRESGREVHIESRDNGRIYLNHIALANMVSKHSKKAAGVDNVDQFFKTLLAQDISIDGINDRICMSRFLPLNESIFDRTREILFGYNDENGKGGILSELLVKGIECDLQSVYLYRAPKLLNPVDEALELDLDNINALAHHSQKRFYQSLLGKFLVPELQQADDLHQPAFAPLVWMPGMPPKSTRRILDALNNHDLVLLEGPPGTGKTFTIMNLLIQCINNKQRVLIVSDQQAAIEALVEKVQEYLIGKDKGTPAERKWNELLFSAIKVIDEVETGDQNLQDLVSKMEQALMVQELVPGTPRAGNRLEKRIKLITDKIEVLTAQIAFKMHAQMGDDVAFDHRVPRTADAKVDLNKLLQFVEVIKSDKKSPRKLIDDFVKMRFKLLEEQMEDCYLFFKIPMNSFDIEIERLRDDKRLLAALIENKVKSVTEFQSATNNYPRHELVRYLDTVIEAQTSAEGGFFTRTFRKLRVAFRSPLRIAARKLQVMVTAQIALLRMSEDWSEELWQLLREMHESIRLGEAPSSALSIYRSLDQKSNNTASADNTSVQGDLEHIEDLYQQRDQIVRERFVENLRDIVLNATASKRSGTNKITRVMALADSLKQFDSVAESGSVIDELRQLLYDIFPVWAVRKQVVPFLLPCVAQSFDLVIIDEATQCRVDDSLSLMFRAKKILVVGDDKQTVLQKQSVIDDYLFKDHELDEHLRSTQARGFKGGGSNIFNLVKSIKQASVMLDEHYRCPAEIIEFSNKYVYDNELKIMKWRLPEHASSVEVDYSERGIEVSKKATRGKFKGIETEMLDRFMAYVVSTVKKIEKTTGKKIDINTDVALCYFLLKNEPYVKSIKDHYLRKLNRGNDLLDGAGAALQGKERDYIFYLWDVSRYNVGSFKQGDDADKRKGELNVLMSRPKKKAFHFLFRDFEELDHSRTNITRYLWDVYNHQQDAKNSPSLIDSSLGEATLRESLLGSMLQFTLQHSSKRSSHELRQNVQQGGIDFRKEIMVGDAGRVVDLIAFPAGKAEQIVGLVDLAGFGCDVHTGQNVVDYYFQLKRVSPGIDPVFVFPHELIDENAQSYRSVMQKLDKIKATSTPT